MSQEASKLQPDDPVFALAGDVYERLRADLPPEDAIAGAISSTYEFVKTCGQADSGQVPWGWILQPVFDLPAGWSTVGADPVCAELAQAAFGADLTPVVVRAPEGPRFLAVPVIGHDEADRPVAGGLIAIPLLEGAALDDNVLVGVATGGGILGVQLENAMRARAARRSLQFTQAASATQRTLSEPTDRAEALAAAMNNLAGCDALTWGAAYEVVDGQERELAHFGQSQLGDERPGLAREQLEALRSAASLSLPVVIEGEREARIELQAEQTLSVVERDTLGSIATAIEGTIVRFRAAETIDLLRRSATRRLVEAQERERSMIAADIHDGVLQQLGATAIRLELAQSRVEQSDFATASSIIADGAKEIRSCARDLRALLMELRPQVLDDNGLNAALNELGRHVDGVEVTVNSDLPDELGSEYAITIFRIVQEALTNIEKHAQAQNAQVELQIDQHAIEIKISDDGVGYEAARTGPSSGGSHLGLLGMRERAQMFGGVFEISGAKGRGTDVRVSLPLDGLAQENL